MAQVTVLLKSWQTESQESMLQVIYSGLSVRALIVKAIVVEAMLTKWLEAAIQQSSVNSESF